MTDDPIREDREQGPAAREPGELPRSREEESLQAFREMVALERQRIDVADRRTEVALRAIEASDAADKRQYDYHVERLRKTAEERSEQRRSVFRIVWAFGGAAALVAALLLLMLFFGTDAQRETAGDLLQTALTGLGGAGILWLLRTLFKRAMSQNRDY